MNEQDLELIERQYRGELTEAERLAFEERLSGDPEFRAAVRLHARAMAAIRLHGRGMLKEQLGARPLPEQKRAFWPWNWQVFAAIAVVLAACWWWYRGCMANPPAPQPVERPTHSSDSIPPAQHLSPASETPPATHPGNPKIPAHPPVAGRTDAQKLFAANFKPYEKGVLGSRRAGNETPTSVLEQFLNAYRDKRYSTCLTTFEQLPDNIRSRDIALFVRAYALLATGDAAGSVPLFEGIAANPGSTYAAPARWYLALALLKSNELPKARQLFLQIEADSTSDYHSDAALLLKGLR